MIWLRVEIVLKQGGNFQRMNRCIVVDRQESGGIDICVSSTL
jgi:hypothetical protein